MADHSFAVYVDESGDEGFVFQSKPGQGSTKWFILSAVIIRKPWGPDEVKLVDGVRADTGRPPGTLLRFRNMKHSQKRLYIDRVAGARLRTINILVHKPSINSPERFTNGHTLYFYVSRLLLERISWYCRDMWRPNHGGDGSADIVFDNRSSMSYEELREYIDRLEAMSRSGHDIQIDWNVIKRDQVHAKSSLRGLQVADAVASGIGAGLNENGYGHTEDRFARELIQTLYHNQGKRDGYGIKIWPREAESHIDGNSRYDWIGDARK